MKKSLKGCGSSVTYYPLETVIVAAATMTFAIWRTSAGLRVATSGINFKDYSRVGSNLVQRILASFIVVTKVKRKFGRFLT
ncbi:hypothetical protein HZH68_007440 [Vespula germanica]|uniref:Uncharacterized protein n=1 Tax=Vespula germanica TaxID=30212 RepID=A0A834K839_VESGE|nr:hypothetical protein HZH68_007440 [Vespula germanica]